MSYVLPKDISHQFNVSLQTVYNYLKKYEWSIRTKKDSGKTFVHVDDFTKFLQGSFNDFKSSTENTVRNSPSNEKKLLQANLKKLETENRTLAIQIQDKEKYNNNLSDQLSKYALMLSEEKSEKKEILGKYESVQKEYHEKVETLFREKNKIERRYYLLLGILIVLLFFFGWLIVNSNWVGNF